MPFELLQKPIDIPKCVYHLHNPFAKAYIRANLMIFSEKRCLPHKALRNRTKKM